MTTITLPLWLAWVVCGTCFLYTIRCIVEGIAAVRNHLREVKFDHNMSNLERACERIIRWQQHSADDEHEEQR